MPGRPVPTPVVTRRRTHVPTVELNNGVSIPQLGFGVFLIAPEETEAAVTTALQVGYRHVDTASAYQNEREVGTALASSEVPREFALT